MSAKRPLKLRKRAGHKRMLPIEVLEQRTLLAASTQTFTGPSLAQLIQMAHDGQNTSTAAINSMLGALQTQLTSGPLADLQASNVDGNGFVAEVQSLEMSYEQNVDKQLSPEFPNIDRLLKLQGQRIVADEIS